MAMLRSVALKTDLNIEVVTELRLYRRLGALKKKSLKNDN
jgi:hypothetical protein